MFFSSALSLGSPPEHGFIGNVEAHDVSIEEDSHVNFTLRKFEWE